MELKDYILLIFTMLFAALYGQVEASGNIGNRPYSIWYETHFLIGKKGICKLIYFKPKHFDRYTFYEVFSFFASYVLVFVFAVIGVLRYFNLITFNMLVAICGSIGFVCLLSTLVIVLVNDIGSHRDEKKRFYLETGERETIQPHTELFLVNQSKIIADVIQHSIETRNQTYFTKYNLWDSYRVRLKQAKNDIEKRNQVNLDYIEYFKNITILVVIKENKNGSLQLKIKE